MGKHILPVGEAGLPVEVSGTEIAVVRYEDTFYGFTEERLFLLEDGQTYVVWQEQGLYTSRTIQQVSEEDLRSGKAYPRLALAAGMIDPIPVEKWLADHS